MCEGCNISAMLWSMVCRDSQNMFYGIRKREIRLQVSIWIVIGERKLVPFQIFILCSPILTKEFVFLTKIIFMQLKKRKSLIFIFSIRYKKFDTNSFGDHSIYPSANQR